jgi:hypothetical protein
MEAPERGALMLVLFIAAILVGWTVVDLGLYFAICQHDQVPMRLIPCLLKSLPLLAGVIALIKSKALAEWVSSRLDD